MRVYSLAVSIWDEHQQRYALDEAASVWQEYVGVLCEAKGASAEQKNLENQQAGFYQTLQQSYQTQFAQQTAILDALNKAWGPILAAGPSQRGFAPAESTALHTQATEGTAAEYQKAAQAANEALAARGGGNEFLPSGGDAQLRSQVATAAAADQAAKNLKIETDDFNTGRNLFQSATAALTGTAGLYNPTGYAGAANAGGSAASTTANDMAKLDNSGGFWGTVGGLLGGAVQSGLNAYTGGIGSKAAKGGGGGCWILTALYGKDTPKTQMMWAWLTNPEAGLNQRFAIGKKFVDWYYRCGEVIAAKIRESRIARFFWKPVFDILYFAMLCDATWWGYVRSQEVIRARN